MYDRQVSERNIIPSLSDENLTSLIDKNHPDYPELEFHFNTLLNDFSNKKLNANDNNNTIYEIERAYTLKNQYIALNFEKREKNEVSAYGWFSSEVTDDKKIDELANRLKTKGLEKIEHEIMVSSIPNNEDKQIIIICKFIVGESEVIFQDEELNEDKIEKYKSIPSKLKSDTTNWIANEQNKHLVLPKTANYGQKRSYSKPKSIQRNNKPSTGNSETNPSIHEIKEPGEENIYNLLNNKTVSI